MKTNNKKPNVLFIMSDQHNAKVLGCKGHPNVKTPNLDKMAEEGVLFDRAITQNPICTPSRVSFLSGQYCHNHGYYGLEGENPGGLPNIISHFRASGYFTSAIGKIHCPEYWVEDASDVFHEVCGPCSINGQSEDFVNFLKELNNLYFDPEYAGIIRDIKDGYIEWLASTTRVRTIFPAVPSICFDGLQARYRYENTVNRDGRFNPAHILKTKDRNCNYI